jgi:Sulfotransferase family
MITNKFLLTYFQWAKPLYLRVHPHYWPIQARYRREYKRPQVVFMSGMPRAGTTLGKRYLGDHEQLHIVPWGHFSQAWQAAQKLSGEKIIVDKNNKNLTNMTRIYREYGNQAAYLGIIRDPRDELMSLLETDYDPEIPRNERFWLCWVEQYSAFITFAQRQGTKGTRVALVRYEDLALLPVQTKQSFLDWLGLDKAEVSSALYHTTVTEIARGKNKTEDWKAHQVNEVHDHSVGRWRAANGNTAELIQSYQSFPAAGLMTQLGYGEVLGSPLLDTMGVKILGFNPAEEMYPA